MNKAGSQVYPAAHSMDTTWFAVDAAGQLAMFDSYETGGVPEHYLQQVGGETGMWDFYPRLEKDEQGVVHYHRDPRYVFDLPDGQKCFDYEGDLLELKTEQDLLDLAEFLPFDEEGVLVRFAVDQSLCVFTNLRDYIDPRVVIRQRTIYADLLGHVFGLFRYEIYQDYSAAWPYSLVTSPQSPVQFGAINAQCRALFAVVEFSTLQFQFTPKIQPFEFWPSAAWQRAWADGNGIFHLVK